MNNSAITQFHNSIIPKGDHDGLRPVAYEQDAGGYYPSAFKRKSAYPLDSKCLYESWYTGTNETGYSVCSCKPELELSADIGDFDFLSVELETTGGMSDEAKAKLYLDGALIWTDTAVHSSYGGDTFQTTSNRLSDSGGCDDSCGGCADGNCDAIDGPSSGSVRFRMSLGIPQSNNFIIPGFLYFNKETVFTPTVDSLILLKRPDMQISDTTTNGVRTVVSNAEGGFTAIVSPVENGISIVSLFTDTLSTNRSWRITLENGAMRFRKFSAGENLMEDRLFAENAAGEWIETDGIMELWNYGIM